MTSNINLQVLGSFEELVFSEDSKSSKLIVKQLGPLIYGLLFFNFKTSRFSLFKLILSKSFIDKKSLDVSLRNRHNSPFQACLLKIFCMPFNLLDAVQSGENIYVIGYKDIVDLKPYLQSVLKEDETEEESMDIDQVGEFSGNMFEVNIENDLLQSHTFHSNDIVIGCDFIDYGLIKCSDDDSNNVWCLELIILKETKTYHCRNTMKIVNIPKVCNKNTASTCSFGAYSPVIHFIHHSDTKYQVLQKVFGLSCLISSAVILIGHPDGSLMWTSYDFTGKSQQLPQLHTLYSMKQPITGIHFVDVGSHRNCTFFLVVGAFGQVTFFSMEMIPSFTIVRGTHAFWTLTVHLKLTIQDSVVMNDCLLHLSTDRTLSITDLSLLVLSTSDKSWTSATPTNFCNINQLVIVDSNKELALLTTDHGNIYVVGFCKEKHIPSSLPFLMNECLQQSAKMQELMCIKANQNRLFAMLSKFASLKFGVNAVKENFPFSVTQVDENPEKYILMIGLKPLEQLNVDPELCFVSVSVFTYFGKDRRLVSKTMPYNPEQEAVCIELIHTDLQSPFAPVFPLLVEIGVILQLPEVWKNIPCLKIVSSCLPFYLSLQFFRVYKLHLLQNNVLCFPQSHVYKKEKVSFKAIKKLGMERPFFALMQDVIKKEYDFPTRFNLCLSLSSVEDMMKDSGGTDACKFIEELLTKNNLPFQAIVPSALTARSCLLSVSVMKKDSFVVVTLSNNFFESLVGVRMAIMDFFLQSQIMASNSSSSFINIPASMYRRCEDVSKSVMDHYGKDVHAIEVTEIIKLYHELRDISEKLPIF